MNRWDLLTLRQKKIVWHYVVLAKKRLAVAYDCGISVKRLGLVLEATYLLLGVECKCGLGFFVGRNYEKIELEAVSLGFPLPSATESKDSSWTAV